jgi:hypothetical protein
MSPSDLIGFASWSLRLSPANGDQNVHFGNPRPFSRQDPAMARNDAAGFIQQHRIGLIHS